jgi:DNA polymerase III subunit epsilon
MAGKVLLVHFAHIEKKFLQHACKKLYGFAPDYMVISTDWI